MEKTQTRRIVMADIRVDMTDIAIVAGAAIKMSALEMAAAELLTAMQSDHPELDHPELDEKRMLNLEITTSAARVVDAIREVMSDDELRKLLEERLGAKQ